MGYGGVISPSILGWPGDFYLLFPPVGLLKSKTLSCEIYQPQTARGQKDAYLNSAF